MSYDDLGEQLQYIDDAYSGDGGGPSVPRRSRKQVDPRLFHKIATNESDLKVLTIKAWNAVNHFNKPPHLFSHGGTPVRLIGGKQDQPTTAQDLSVDTLSRESAETAYWHKLMDKGDYMQPQFPPERVMRNMLADADPPLPPLKRITAAPVFGPKGELETTPGYHESTAHFYDARGLVIPPVSTNPTNEDIESALTLVLNAFLGDFPFVGRSEIAHALSLMLNPFVRDMIPGPTPLYGIESPTAGTGKGLLARMAVFPSLGSEPTLMTQSDSEEETRKRITGTLIGLPETILLDNIADGLDSPNLAAVLTTREWSDRILGRSETRTIPVRCTWIATGNNPSKSSELARRMVRIRLDAKVERPEERRDFKHPDLEAWAALHRGELVHACLTIVQGWIAAGRPTSGHTLGSYNEWAAIHGGILQFCNVNGFLENRNEDRMISVTEDATWTQFTEIWWDKFRNTPVGVSDLFALARDIDDFPLGKSPSERGQRTAFGMSLTRNRNRMFSGREIVFDGTDKRAARYRLVSPEPDF